MADNKMNQEQMYALLQFVSRRLNVTPAELARALSGDGLEGLTARLSPENAARLQAMMGDRAKAQQLLDSPQAQALIRRLLENDMG